MLPGSMAAKPRLFPVVTNVVMKMMKKAFILLACLQILILPMFGCQNSSTKGNESITETKTIKNTTEIVIGYAANSYIAEIKDQEEIRQLEDLFNGAEFTKSDVSIQQPYLSISFSGQRSSALFRIDDKDVIQLRDGNCLKSKQINFNKLYSIFYEYSSKKK